MMHEIIDDMRGHWEEAYKAALQRTRTKGS